MKDLYDKITAESVLHSIVLSATATYTDIDLQGYNSCVLLIDVGVDAGSGLGESNLLTFTLQDSADGTTYANVETADMSGGLTVTSGVILTVDSTDKDNTLYKRGYVGGKRYLQLVCTETGTCSVPISIIVLKGDPENAPVA